MRCVTARRRLSDALDGALGPARRARLESHLRDCPDCRGHRDILARLQAASRSPEAPAGGWEAFEKRVEARLQAEETGRARVRAPFAARRLRAWAAAAALVLAGVALWRVFLGPAPVPQTDWYAYEDVVGPLAADEPAGPALSAWVDREMGAEIAGAMPAGAGESALVPADDPFFWEGLTDEELKAVALALEGQEDPGQGGPR